LGRIQVYHIGISSGAGIKMNLFTGKGRFI
jgi:hypothetical protein